MADYLRSTQRSVSWLASSERAGTLNIAPAFQRYTVWTDKQKAFLLDSIIREYPVPELYMQESIEDDGTEQHVVVDGQQRIRACLDFIDGRFSLNEDDTPEYPGLVFDELPTEVRQTIFQYQFVVRVLPAMPTEQLRAIFGRLNRNVVALNAQELRHATYWGPFIRQMEGLADHSFWRAAGIFTANDVRRMLDVEFISELAVAMLHGPQNKKVTLDEWYAVYEQSYEAEDEVGQRMKSVLGEIARVLPELESTRWRKKSDFYSLFLAFDAHQDDLPFSREQRSELQDKLSVFARAVDRVLRDPEAKASKRARRYASAVERAASDVAQRRARSASLEALFTEAL